jgi:uncharacterized protein (TIGR00251 family)
MQSVNAIKKALSETSKGCLVRLHIQPNAKKNEIVGLHGESLKVRLQAPPVEGKANAALIKYLADILDCSKSSLFIKSGDKSRQKSILVVGMSIEEIAKSFSDLF